MSRSTNNTTNTALAVFFIAFAVVLIGGLALVPTATTMQSASAEARSNFGQCLKRLPETGPDEDETRSLCETAILTQGECFKFTEEEGATVTKEICKDSFSPKPEFSPPS